MSTQVQFKDYSMGFKDDDGKVYNLIDHLNMQLDEPAVVSEKHPSLNIHHGVECW